MTLRPTCAAAVLFAATLSLSAQSQAHWVGSWSTAPLQTTDTGRTVVLGAPEAPAPPPAIQPNAATPTPPSPATVPAPVGTPAPTPPRSVPDAVNGAGRPIPGANVAATPVVPTRPAPLGSEDVTLDQIVHLSLGGTAVRVVFTNEYGSDPLIIGRASIMPTSDLHSDPPSPPLHPLSFGGKPGIVIPPGAIAVSDPVSDYPVEPLSDLAVSVFLPAQPMTHLTRHTGALQTSYLIPGDKTYVGAGATPVYSWTFLKSVDVLAPASAASVVAFGDSITDGAYATRDKNARWPDDLARRLQANPRTKNLAVLDEGIGGNRVLYDNTGPSALARFTRDALDQAGVKYIIVLEAINDIGNAFRPTKPKDPVTAETLIQGYQQLIDRAHVHGIKVFLATLTPYGGASYMSPEGDKVRQAVNQWIRSNKEADGMIDFDKATLDPANPDKFLPAYDHGDHLHPTDAGLKAMADAIDLSLFTK